MGSGVKKDAFANSGKALNQSTGLYNQASNLYGSLAPQLLNESVNPQGYSPTDLAAQTTANMQAAGGTSAGAAGQGKLYEMRTRNAGAAGNAISQGAEAAGQQLGQRAVQTQVNDANLKERQREGALGDLGALYGTDLGASQNALGLSNQALDVANKTKPSFWQSAAADAMSSLLDNSSYSGKNWSI